jgi:hypothetical protein
VDQVVVEMEDRDQEVEQQEQLTLAVEEEVAELIHLQQQQPAVRE